jgi:putative endonuclease
MPWTYILFSASLNKFYIGSTSTTPDERLKKHLSKHTGFTSKADDWIIIYSESFQTINEARKRELQLKKWKSHTKIQQLIKHGFSDRSPRE